MSDIPGNDDVEHVKVCFTCPDDIRQWVQEVTKAGDAPRYNYSGWPGDLWNRAAKEIIDYIEDRFTKTKDVQEYYSCMLYLTKRIDAEELFVRWEESMNYREIQAEECSENSGDNTNIASQKIVSMGFREYGKGMTKVSKNTTVNNVPMTKWRTLQ